MKVIAELLAALVVGLAAAAFTCFGLSLDSGEPDRDDRVRRLPVSAPAVISLPCPDTDAPIVA